MSKSLYLFLFLVSIFYVEQTSAQTGEEFWFVAPNVDSDHTDRPIYLRITSWNEPCIVTIDLPANPNFAPLTLNFTANQTQTVDLTSYITEIETSTPNAISTTGIHISSDKTIAAYYEVRSSGNNTDIFPLKSNNALGKLFFVPAQSFWQNAGRYSQAFSMFLIVATQDSTVVTITPANNLLGHSAGIPFSIMLDKGETYYAQASSRAASGHIGGTKVSATNVIAITIADDSAENDTYGGCKDLIGDQLIPVSRIGDEYIILRGFLKKSGNALDDKVYVLATENNTQVFLDGATSSSFTLSEGQQQEVSLSNFSLYINSTKPVYIIHVTGFGCEVGLAVLPSIYCTGSESISITRSTSEDFYLLLLVPSGSEDFFTTNGNNSIIKKNDFTLVPGTNGQWMMNRLKVATNKIGVSSVTHIKNTASVFHLGLINGGASSGTMYGFFSDFNSVITKAIYHL